MPEPHLALLQSWLQRVIQAEGDLPQKVYKAQRQFGLSALDVVAEKRGLDAGTRLSIYTNGYVLRLLDCLSSDFPGLKAYLGEEMFDLFARGYILSLPPNSPNLFQLSQRFADFLRKTQPPAEQLPPEQRVMLTLPADIADLERARHEAMLAKGFEKETESNPVDYFDLLTNEVHLQTPECLRLRKLGFPLIDFMKSLHREEDATPPSPEPTHYLISRANYHLVLQEVESWQYHFVEALQQGHSSIYQAANFSAQACDKPVSDILADLAAWMPEAEKHCFFRKV